MMLKLLVAAAVFGTVLAATPANADHDMIYAPCDPEETRPLDEQVWYQDYQSQTALRYDDPWWAETPGLAGYTNWEHQCRLGQTGVWQAAPILPLTHPPDYEVETRQTKSACIRKLETTVDLLIAEGLLSSEHVTVTDHGALLHLTSPVPLVEAGVVTEWALGHDGYGRHYLDAYWEYELEGVSNWTFWGIICTELDPAGSNQGATTTSGPTPPTTTQAIEDPVTTTEPPAPTTTQAITPSTTTLIAPVTTTTQATAEPTPNLETPVTTTTQASGQSIPEHEALEPSPPALQAEPNPLPAGYDLFTAQYEGWPFEQTLRLLEERYPQGTPNRYHFRLSSAIDFLRAGGMVGQLDDIWNSG